MSRRAEADNPPFDLRFQTAWNDIERRLTTPEAMFAATNDDDPVRIASIIRVAVVEVVDQAMEQEVLGDRGWAGVVADPPDDDPTNVDALLYLLSVALGSQQPSANVATAGGLSPTSPQPQDRNVSEQSAQPDCSPRQHPTNRQQASEHSRQPQATNAEHPPANGASFVVRPSWSTEGAVGVAIGPLVDCRGAR